MYEVVDVVEFPELKKKLMDGDLAPFKCASCDSPIHLEKRVFFVYWDQDWIGLVVPMKGQFSVTRAITFAEFIIPHTKPNRKNLPSTVFVFRCLDDLLEVVKELNGEI